MLSGDCRTLGSREVLLNINASEGSIDGWSDDTVWDDRVEGALDVILSDDCKRLGSKEFLLNINVKLGSIDGCKDDILCDGAVKRVLDGKVEGSLVCTNEGVLEG